ncbi:hypothetical protein BC830DRAFT_1153546 [Chytriomyces sp. MP71]|nr:hypothetical protein BC830DRAFT_1153546 [Chytriomyces sp. MP71]
MSSKLASLLCLASLASLASANRRYGPLGNNFAYQKSAEEFKAAHPSSPEVKAADPMTLWFSLHDYNHDGYLDGHELRVAITEEQSRDGKTTTLADVESAIDKALEVDLSGDGLISWAEYVDSLKS